MDLDFCFIGFARLEYALGGAFKLGSGEPRAVRRASAIAQSLSTSRARICHGSSWCSSHRGLSLGECDSDSNIAEARRCRAVARAHCLHGLALPAIRRAPERPVITRAN